MGGSSAKMKNPPDFLPRTTRKGYGRDTQGRIYPLPSSDDLKGLWKGYPGKNLPDFLPRTT